MSFVSSLRVANNFFKRGMYDESIIRQSLGFIESYIDGKGPDGAPRGEVDERIVLEASHLLDQMSVDPSVVKRASPELLEEMNLVASRLRRLLTGEEK